MLLEIILKIRSLENSEGSALAQVFCEMESVLKIIDDNHQISAVLVLDIQVDELLDVKRLNVCLVVVLYMLCNLLSGLNLRDLTLLELLAKRLFEEL